MKIEICRVIGIATEKSTLQWGSNLLIVALILLCDCLQSVVHAFSGVVSSTVSQIERRLPAESLAAWRSRATIDYIILVDWHSSAARLDPKCAASCLHLAFTKVNNHFAWH